MNRVVIKAAAQPCRLISVTRLDNLGYFWPIFDRFGLLLADLGCVLATFGPIWLLFGQFLERFLAHLALYFWPKSGRLIS